MEAKQIRRGQEKYHFIIRPKGGFFSESAICFSDLQIFKNKYSKEIS